MHLMVGSFSGLNLLQKVIEGPMKVLLIYLLQVGLG